MWAWIYEGAIIVGGPIVNGCSAGEILASLDAAISGQYTMLTNCWLNGWFYDHVIYLANGVPFTLQ